MPKFRAELAEAGKTKPSTIIKNGRPFRHLVFPSDIKYGGIHFSDGSVDAIGETFVPLDRGNLSLIAAPPLLCYPPAFVKLKGENFKGLSIQHATPDLPIDKVMDMAALWPGLEEITFDECELGHFDFANLSKLKHLMKIEAMESSMDTDNLADWPGLSKLHVFKFSGLLNAQKLVLSVCRAPNLEFLSLAKMPVTPEALDSLGRNPAVSSVSIRECKLTDEDFERLLSAPNLREIYIAEPRVDQQILERLAHFPKLKHITIVEYRRFSAEAKNRFRKAMSGSQCDFDEDKFFRKP